MKSAFLVKIIGLFVVVVVSGCYRTARFGYYCYYEDYGALFVSWTHDGMLFTDLTLDCGEDVCELQSLLVDNVLHVSSSRFVNTSSFSKVDDHLWRKNIESGYIEIYEFDGCVQRIIINKALIGKPPVCMISLGSHRQITIPINKDQLYISLGNPTMTGKMNGFK